MLTAVAYEDDFECGGLMLCDAKLTFSSITDIEYTEVIRNGDFL